MDNKDIAKIIRDTVQAGKICEYLSGRSDLVIEVSRYNRIVDGRLANLTAIKCSLLTKEEDMPDHEFFDQSLDAFAKTLAGDIWCDTDIKYQTVKEGSSYKAVYERPQIEYFFRKDDATAKVIFSKSSKLPAMILKNEYWEKAIIELYREKI